MGSVRNHQAWVTSMHLPGFSAETSLYQTSQSYRTVASSGERGGAGAQVVPNLIYRTWCTSCSGVHGWQYCCTSAPIVPNCFRVRCTTRPPCWDPSCKETNCDQCYWDAEQGCCVKDCYPGCLIGDPDCWCQQGCQPSECGRFPGDIPCQSQGTRWFIDPLYLTPANAERMPGAKFS